jgi:hypothetical protein
MTDPARHFDPDAVQVLARLAGLPLSPDRVPALARELTQMYGALDARADVSLGETPPATAFDPRWR